MTPVESSSSEPREVRDPTREAALAEGLGRLGHAEFRPGQKEAIEGLLDEQRILLVAPTGGGKSLCYHVLADPKLHTQ